MRTVASIALALALVTAGCIGVLDRDEASVDPTSTDKPLDEPASGQVAWTREAGVAMGETTHETAVEPPETRIGALFVEYDAEVSGPDGELEITAELPDGATYPVLSLTSIATTTQRSGWVTLPGFDGTQGEVTFNLRADAEAQVQANVTFLSPRPEPQPVQGTAEDGRVVVALVDTGVNPYHDVFQRPDLTTEKLPARIQAAETGQPPLSLDITPSDGYVASLRADAALWAQVPSQRLVHFEGTNVLGYEIRDRSLPALPVLDRAGHGTMTAHAASREAPDALVVMVTAADYDDGVRWAAQQPWIDLISLSWGPVVNAAGAAEPYATGFDTYEATRTAHAAGQLVFTATGNDPTPATPDTTSGPPWVHAVSGAEPDANGRAVLSGNLIDTVANWTQTLARYDSRDETTTGSGTSFATPTTAGIAAQILHEVRAVTGHEGGLEDGALVATADLTVTSSDLQAALNRSAVYWETTAYDDPTAGPSAPVAPTPWVSMGWGYLDGSRAAPAVDGLLGEQPLPDKPDQAETFMQAQLDARKAWWHDVQGR